MADKKRILIIEDNNSIRRALVDGLSADKYFAFGAKDGSEGLKLAEKENPSLILLDLLLPIMDGVEVLEAMNKNGMIDKIPVIVLTNLDNEEKIDKCMSLGAKKYLLKANFSFDQIFEEIEDVFMSM